MGIYWTALMSMRTLWTAQEGRSWTSQGERASVLEGARRTAACPTREAKQTPVAWCQVEARERDANGKDKLDDGAESGVSLITTEFHRNDTLSRMYTAAPATNLGPSSHTTTTTATSYIQYERHHHHHPECKPRRDIFLLHLRFKSGHPASIQPNIACASFWSRKNKIKEQACRLQPVHRVGSLPARVPLQAKARRGRDPPLQRIRAWMRI